MKNIGRDWSVMPKHLLRLCILEVVHGQFSYPAFEQIKLPLIRMARFTHGMVRGSVKEKFSPPKQED